MKVSDLKKVIDALDPTLEVCVGVQLDAETWRCWPASTICGEQIDRPGSMLILAGERPPERTSR